MFVAKPVPVARAVPLVRENRLFMGNPGTGKSTLINCMVGRAVFRSGLAWGGGLTQEYQKYIANDIVYMDTPGLADQTILRKAAEAITMALSQPGTYKLFFMVRLQNGRVVSDDLATIERVLDSIDMDNIPFSILINNLGKRQYDTLMKLGPEFKQVATLINSGKYSTPHIFFIPTFEGLEEQDNKIITLPDEAIDFIANDAPSVTIHGGAVSDIDLLGYEQQSQRLKDEIEELRRNQAAFEAKMFQLEVQHQVQLELMRMRQHKRCVVM